jgi:Synergist-CTERM protein sorting domain-containing protein
MKKFRSVLIALAALIVAVTPANADLYYSVSDYATGTAGIIIGDNNPQKTVIQNLNNDAIVLTYKNKEGRARLMTVGRDSWISGAGDDIKIYDPYGGQGWNKKPLVEFMTKYQTGPFAGKSDGNLHHVVAVGDFLYGSFWGNTYSYFGVDYTSKVVKWDMANNFEKVAEYLYKPEEENPLHSANAQGIFAYKDHIYEVYDGYVNKKYVDGASCVVKLDLDLNYVDKAPLYGTNFKGGCIYGNKLYVVSNGGDVYTETPESVGMSNIQVIDLDTMDAKVLITAQDLIAKDPEWNLRFTGVQITPEGKCYIQFYNYHMMGGGQPEAAVYETTLEALEASKDIGELLINYNFFGWSTDFLYDETTGFLWSALGTDLYRYDPTKSEGERWTLFDSRALGGNIYNVQIASRFIPEPASNETAIKAAAVPLKALPSDAESADLRLLPYGIDSADMLAEALGVSPDVITQRGDDLMQFDPSRAFEAIKSALNRGDTSVTDINYLPLFKACVPSGTPGVLVALAFEIEGKDLLSLGADGVALFGINPDFTLTPFKYSLSDFRDGTFTLLELNCEIASTIDPSKKYIIVTFAKDGGVYDLSSDDGCIMHAIAIARTVTEGSVSYEERQGHGGCNAGFAALALLLAAPVVIRRRG